MVFWLSPDYQPGSFRSRTENEEQFIKEGYDQLN